MNPVATYFFNLEEPYQGVALYLRALIKKTIPDIVENSKWGLPFYDYNGKYMCYINYRKKTGVVDLSFIQGIHLKSHPEILVNGENRKQIRSVPLSSLEQVNEQQLVALLKEAMALNTNKH